MKGFKLKSALIVILILMMALMSACSSSSSAGGSNSYDSNKSSDSKEESAEQIVFKMGHMVGTDHVQHSLAMQPFSEDVLKATDGRIKFQIYPGGALSAPAETLDSIVTGIQDAGWIVGGYTPGQFPLHSILNLPHLTRGTAEQVAEIAYKMYEKFPEIQAEYSDVKPLWFFGTEENVLMMANKQIKSFEDVKGLKIRAPNNVGALIIESWGAIPVSMSATETYDAMQKGVVDGTLSSMAQLKDFNLFDVVKYITHGDFTNSIMSEPMNKAAWEKIPEQDKKILEEQFIGLPMSKVAGHAFDVQAEKAVEEGKAAGIEFNYLPDEELKKFEEASQSVTENYIADLEKKGLPAQKIYDATKEMFAEIAK